MATLGQTPLGEDVPTTAEVVQVGGQDTTENLIFGTNNSHAVAILANGVGGILIGTNGKVVVDNGIQTAHAPTIDRDLTPKSYVDDAVVSNGPVQRVSGTVQLQLDGEELIWPTDVANGKVRLYNSTPGSNNTFYGFGITNQTFIYQVDNSVSKHQFQSVDGSDTAVVLLDISTDGGVVSHVDLHMSEKKIINIADGDAPRDAINKQQLDAVSSTGATAARPGSPSTGAMYFDTDLGHPIWYNGTAWVDATGTAV